MATNYWASTQRRHWHFSREDLAAMRQELEDEDRNLVQQYPLPDRRLLGKFFNEQLAKLGKRMGVRQQAIATAQIYMRRFYIKVEIRRTNPYLVLSTALYLACKIEECPQHIRSFVSEARQIWPDFIISDVSKLGECEFHLISEMSSQLIVHHPYRTLQHLQGTLNMGSDDISLAWSVINDHYLTDLPLLFPPHIIAITAIFLAMTLKPTQNGLQAATNTVSAFSGNVTATKDSSGTTPGPSSAQQKKLQHLATWLAEGEISIESVVEASQDMISLYDVWEQYNEKACKEQIARFVKARGLDK